jgi:hypothetical protein
LQAWPAGLPGGLVKHQHPGLHGQHAGDGHGALFTTGQAPGRAAGQVPDTDLLQRGLHALLHLAGRQALVAWAEGHVFVHRGHEELVVGVLEDIAHPLPYGRQ